MTDLSTKCEPLLAIDCTSDQCLSRQMPIGKNPMAERCRRPPLSVSSNTLEKVLGNYGAELKEIEQKQRQALVSTEMVIVTQMIGVSVKTVQRYLSLPDLPETPSQRRSLRQSSLEPYKQIILEWWNAIKCPGFIPVVSSNGGSHPISHGSRSGSCGDG